MKMAQHDNYIESRGFGEWVITTYNPEKEFGVYEGFLKVSRDFHVIYAQDNNSGVDASSECIASFPSPNVAAAENTIFTRTEK
jgi:hypothetical protein